jgi:hypothetical protein
MSGEVHPRSGRRLQRVAQLDVAAAVIVFSGILLSVMQSEQIQLATTIVAVVLLTAVAMTLYYV